MTDESAATAIAVRTSTDLAQLDEFDRILTGQAEPPEVVDDPELISREIMLQLLAAESDEDLQRFGDATGWRELIGRPVRLFGFKWRPSSYDEGGPVYVIVNAADAETGEALVLTCGSSNVLAQLSNMARRGTLTGSVWMLVESEKLTARGYRPLHLEKVASAE